MYNDITCFILSGGKSSRMGRNKSLLKINNQTIIEYIIALLKTQFSDIYLVTNSKEEYEFLNIPMYEDIYKNMGPLGGIHSALTHSGTEKNFIISCDIPLITNQMISYLIDFKTDKKITVAKAEGYIQQLCGVYNKSCADEAEKILTKVFESDERNNDQKKRGCKVLSLISSVETEIINAEALPFYTSDLFFNMNKQTDYDYVLKQLRYLSLEKMR